MHQRRLASAVFAQQRVHFSGVRHETSARERLHGAESLVNVAELEEGCSGHMPVG
jgi:hypothetical protein